MTDSEVNKETVEQYLDSLPFDPANEVSAEPDSITVPGQKYALVSFVSPESNQKCKHIAMKLSGVFSSQEEAGKHAKRLMDINPLFDIYVMEMYNWAVVPPNAEQIDSEWGDERLDSLMKGYKEQRINAHAELQKRKSEAVKHPSEVEAAGNELEQTPTELMESMQ